MVISLIPLLISILIFAAGIVLIVSGSMPPLIYRVKILKDVLPVFTIKVSHFLGSITGADPSYTCLRNKKAAQWGILYDN